MFTPLATFSKLDLGRGGLVKTPPRKQYGQRKKNSQYHLVEMATPCLTVCTEWKFDPVTPGRCQHSPSPKSISRPEAREARALTISLRGLEPWRSFFLQPSLVGHFLAE